MNKPPVLFLPGTLCTAAVFESQIDELARLAPRVDVVQFTSEDSISKMADTAIEKISAQNGAAIIGFSMGGMVAMEIARKAPQLIHKLALVNTNAHPDLPDRQAARLAHLQLARSKGMEYVIRQHYLHRYLHRPDANAGNLIVKMACESGISCFDAQIRALTTRVDSSTTLAGLECPTLVLGAEQDQLCPVEGQLQMHHLVEGSELLILENCGHFSMLEQAALVNTALRKWYQTTAVPLNLARTS